jgi:hypothetical protein
MKQFCLLAAFLSMATSLLAQPNPKMDEFIVLIGNTKFIKDYKLYKQATETKIQALKLAFPSPTGADLSEMNQLKIAYKQSQFKFDAILDQLKIDITTATGRKRIVKNSAAFSNTYNRMFEGAQVHCNNHFHQRADKLLNPNKDGDPLTMLVIDMLINVIKNYVERQASDKAVNVVYLESAFIEPLRFKSWVDIKDL